MKLSELKSLTGPQAATLEANGRTVENLATSTVKQLTAYKGIGKITAQKVIEEAAALINSQGLEDAEQLAKERYYQKAPARKIVEDWVRDDGMILQDIAMASAHALAAVKGIKFDQALEIISAAQDILNKEKLYESRQIGGSVPETVPATSAAFPAEWLSGAVEPPPMGARVARNFERAQEAYKAAKDG
jgi:ribosomal protein S13